MKKIVSAALALMIATTTLANAVNDYPDQSSDRISAESCRQLALIGKTELSNINCIICPDQPESNPEQTPDVKPEETPEQTLDVKTEETPDNNPDAALNDYAAEVVRLVNAEREKNGLAALSVDTGVQAAAQVRAAEQAELFSHTRPDGSSCFTALTEQSVTYRTAGENIAYGQQTPEAVMNAWMNSSGHRANILGSQFTKIGVGYTVINGTPYWAQMFIS